MSALFVTIYWGGYTLPLVNLVLGVFGLPPLTWPRWPGVGRFRYRFSSEKCLSFILFLFDSGHAATRTYRPDAESELEVWFRCLWC